jgi:hypothetical protein
VLIFVRQMQSLIFYKRVGVLYIIVLNMFPDVLDWIIVVVAVSLGFGVAFTVLLPGDVRDAHLFRSVLRQLAERRSGVWRRK